MTTYLVTGANGYIGSMLVKHLLELRDDIQVIALVRDTEKMKRRAAELFPSAFQTGRPGVDPFIAGERICKRLLILQADLSSAQLINQFAAQSVQIDYIFHCASVTRSAEMIKYPVEVTRSIINGTQNVLEIARGFTVKSMVYFSSMEVYGSIDCPAGRRVTEQEAEAGCVEILNLRSCYPLGKRMAENICYGYYKEYGVPVKIARLAQTFGRGILSSDNRIFAQIAKAVKSGTDIVLHTEGLSMGNYCSIDDVISGVMMILEHGENGEAYNVVNEANTMTIREMAELAAVRLAGGRIRVRYDLLPDHCRGYAAYTGLRLSGEKLMRLGWRPVKTLEEMYQDIILEKFNQI